MNSLPTQWLIFTASLAGPSASTPRVRLWRALKELGAATLRDGVALLPASSDHREKLLAIGVQLETEGGSAWLFELPEQAAATEARLRLAFDRTEAWQALRTHLQNLGAELPGLDEASARRRLRQAKRELENIARVDFFPNDEQAKAVQVLDQLTTRANRRFSPEEPSATRGGLVRRKRQEFSGLVWATRRRLWIDRVASAWLIKRFIDEQARFLWLDQAAHCPAEALGFDFDGATFSHVDELVTFEVLLASFGLETDAGLAALGRLVHYLDVGGEPVAEAAGFEAVLSGLREAQTDDDELLAATTPVLDALRQHFLARDKPRSDLIE